MKRMETNLKLPFVYWAAVMIAVSALDRDATVLRNATEPRLSNDL